MCSPHIAISGINVAISSAFTIPRIIAFIHDAGAVASGSLVGVAGGSVGNVASAAIAGIMGASIGNVAASVISLTAGILAKKQIITFKAALIVTAIASAASIIASIVTLVVLGAPAALIATGVVLSVLYGLSNTFSAYKSYKSNFMTEPLNYQETNHREPAPVFPPETNG